MLKQHRLMAELEKIAAEDALPVVDNIKIVDQDRRRLSSWVHLIPEANQRLAEALESVIKPYVLQARANGSTHVMLPRAIDTPTALRFTPATSWSLSRPTARWPGWRR